jgi:hypothetical protein
MIKAYAAYEPGGELNALRPKGHLYLVGVVPNPLYIPLLSLSGSAISKSIIRQSIQAILLEKPGGCICC